MRVFFPQTIYKMTIYDMVTEDDKGNKIVSSEPVYNCQRDLNIVDKLICHYEGLGCRVTVEEMKILYTTEETPKSDQDMEFLLYNIDVGDEVCLKGDETKSNRFYVTSVYSTDHRIMVDVLDAKGNTYQYAIEEINLTGYYSPELRDALTKISRGMHDQIKIKED